MLCFFVNLLMLFGEYDFFVCFEKVVQCGFCGVEFMFFYDYDIEELKYVLVSNKFEYMLYNLLVGDWVVGECGIVCIFGCEEEFWDGVVVVICYVCVLGNKKINCLVGKMLVGFSSEQIYVMFVENLCYVVNMLMKEDILLLIEFINYFDISGFYFIGIWQVLKLIDDVGCCNLKIQYDIYYMQWMEGELINIMIQWVDKIGYL